MNKRNCIHEKLEIMKQCYKERDLKNLDLIQGTFFKKGYEAILIGTDNGEWFRTEDQIRELFTYDWQYWGDISIDTWGFTENECGPYDFVRVKALLDFREDRAWDVDILMIFEECEDDLTCRLMQFKIPRNIIRPTVIVSKDETEQQKFDMEKRDINLLRGEIELAFPTGDLAESLKAQVAERRPDWEDVTLPEEQTVALSSDEKHFYFAGTGLCTKSGTDNVMPFRITGIGTFAADKIEIVDSEPSHPFVCALG